MGLGLSVRDKDERDTDVRDSDVRNYGSGFKISVRSCSQCLIFSRGYAFVFVRIRYFAKNECLCSFVFAIMQVKLEHARVRPVFVCLPLKYERNKGSFNSFVVKGNLET